MDGATSFFDLRKRIVRAVEGGLSRRAAAARFAVSQSCAIKLVQRWKHTGSVAPTAIRAPKGTALAAHKGLVRELVAAHPDITLDELQARLAEQAIMVGRTSVHRCLEKLGLTPKKTLHPSEQARLDVAAARTVWREGQANLNPARLVFIDETWVNTNMTRPYGRAPRGQRLVASVPY